MFVERPGEVTVQKFIVVDSLGNNPANKLEVAEMVRVTMRTRVDGVCNTISLRCGKQCIVRIENLPRYNDVPFSK